MPITSSSSADIVSIKLSRSLPNRTDQELRIFGLRTEAALADLFEKVAIMFPDAPAPRSFKWTDGDGDLITIATDDDLTYALAEHAGRRLKLFVGEAATALPSPPAPTSETAPDSSSRASSSDDYVIVGPKIPTTCPEIMAELCKELKRKVPRSAGNAAIPSVDHDETHEVRRAANEPTKEESTKEDQDPKKGRSALLDSIRARPCLRKRQGVPPRNPVSQGRQQAARSPITSRSSLLAELRAGTLLKKVPGGSAAITTRFDIMTDDCLDEIRAYKRPPKQPVPGNHLYWACANGRAGEVRAMLARGADPRTRVLGLTALHVACTNGHVQVARELVKAGAAMTAVDRHGYSPLEHACRKGRGSVVNFLAMSGAPWDAPAREQWRKMFPNEDRPEPRSITRRREHSTC